MDTQATDPFERVQRVVGRRGAEPAGSRPEAGAGDDPAVEPVRPRVREATRWRVGGLPVGVVAVGVLVAGVVVAGLALGRSGPEGYVVGPGGVATAPVTAPVTAVGALPVPGASAAPAPGAVAAPAPVPSAGAGAAAPPPAASKSTAAVTSPPTPAPVLLVHVDGAVEHPGVVRLLPGDRVSDAVEAAGGVLPEADTRLVNLARPVVDGELVVVPAEGEQAVPVPGPGDPPATAGPQPPPGGTDPGGLVSLNTADATALQELPGIGPVLAGRIVAWRDEVGPFTSVEELTSVSGIGPAVLEQVRDLVTV
ncbi:helix-hairpin-helix domain-containing protein [Aquipuribacter sp. SD81]|uniref:helix-hairpin-helix domain-containing protein n=1 Tax=Aquipuribacter sp. SD81 TaxID=3127703 RepID=UPI003015B448